MTFDVIMTIYIILNGIVYHIMWKRIENLEKWVLHLLEQADDELLRRWKGASDDRNQTD